MAVSIFIPNTPWSRQTVSLSGRNYIFEVSYNERSKRWYIDISLSGSDVVNSVKVMENYDLTGRYCLQDFPDGELFCARLRETSDPVGRDNFGIGKDYELLYLTLEEIEQLGL